MNKPAIADRGKQILIQPPQDVTDKLIQYAEKDRRTLKNFTEKIVDLGLERYEKKT